MRQYHGAFRDSSGYRCDTMISPGAKRTVQKRKRRKGAETERENIYSPHEETLERLRLFYHREKVSMSNTMKT